MKQAINLQKMFILDDSFFGQIKDFQFIPHHVWVEFINNYVYNSKNVSLLLRRFSDIFVLMAFDKTEAILKSGEKSWSDFMTPDQLQILAKNGYYIVGFILVQSKE